MPRFRPLIVLVLGAALSGCGLFDKEKPPPCPMVSILADAAQVTKFRPGDGRDLIDMLYEGRMTGLTVACEFKRDKEDEVREDEAVEAAAKKGAPIRKTLPAGVMTINLTLELQAALGAALKGNRADFRYFVALTGPDKDMISKKEFPLSVNFPGNATVVTVQDQPLALVLPIKPNESPRRYTIFTGFQLDSAELEYNRKRQER